MPAPKILIIPGSIRIGSDNARLAALAAKELTLADAEVTAISLTDYPMPLYDPNVEALSGAPPNAARLRQMIAAHHGVFVTTPELNATVPPLMINTLAWVSRVRDRGDSANGAFQKCVFALGSATRESHGGIRALMALRQVLEIGCGALVIPEQIAVAEADEAFDDMDNLKDQRNAEMLRKMARRLVALSWERLDA